MPRQKGAIRRQQIIDVARQTLIDLGMAGLILRDVADRIGITHGNLQYYFATKDDLVVAVFDQELDRYTHSMHEAVKQTSTRQGRVSAIIDSAISVIRGESTTLWLMLFSLARQNGELCTILEAAYQKYDESLAGELALVDPGLSWQRRLHIAQMVRMMLDGFGVQATYDDPVGAHMIALQSEIKAAVLCWFDVEQAA